MSTYSDAAESEKDAGPECVFSESFGGDEPSASTTPKGRTNDISSTSEIVRDLRQAVGAELHSIDDFEESMTSMIKRTREQCFQKDEALAELEKRTRKPRPRDFPDEARQKLTSAVNNYISNCNLMLLQNEEDRKSNLEEALKGRDSIGNMTEAEADSAKMKRHLNKLADILELSGDEAALEEAKCAMKSWGEMHRRLMKERENAEKRWKRQDKRAWSKFFNDRDDLREQILALWGLAKALELDWDEILDDASRRETNDGPAECF